MERDWSNDDVRWNCRAMVEQDFEQIFPMLKLWQAESVIPLTFSRKNARLILQSLVEGEFEFPYVAPIIGPIGGFTSISFEPWFSNELTGHVSVFYVSPDSRGTPVARSLAAQLADTADAMDAAVTYVSSTAGLDEQANRLFCNLFGRMGFKQLGPVLMRTRNP